MTTLVTSHTELLRQITEIQLAMSKTFLIQRIKCNACDGLCAFDRFGRPCT